MDDEERTAKFMDGMIGFVVNGCFAWEKMENCAEALKVWFRRPPTSERQWYTYIRVLKVTGDQEAAEEAKKAAQEAFPDSDLLERL